MDLIHENPTKARDYIKRLLKHKNIGTEGTAVNLEHYGTWEGGQTKVVMSIRRQLEGRVSMLEGQLLSRNREIQRLQNLLVGIYVNIQNNVKWLLVVNGKTVSNIKKQQCLKIRQAYCVGKNNNSRKIHRLELLLLRQSERAAEVDQLETRSILNR